MQKLNHLYKTLLSLHHPIEANLIKKLAREYAESVTEKGLSSKFYAVTSEVSNDISYWTEHAKDFIIKEFSRNNSDIDKDSLFGSVNSCFYEWTSKYSASIGASDTNIPPFLFQFLESKLFPIMKEAFSEAIDELPADSETKLGLQSWLSATTLEQLGVTDIKDLLDGGGNEFWINSVNNLLHEIHHNIINHSAWKRFYNLGIQPTNYNLLDAMDEGFVSTVQNAHRGRTTDDVYEDLAGAMADFMIPILQRIVAVKLGLGVNQKLDSPEVKVEVLLDNLGEIDKHLAKISSQISGEGFKNAEEKLSFLKRVFFIFKSTSYMGLVSNWESLREELTSIISQVWNESEYNQKENKQNNKWDFLTGDDAKLLINLMKKLDQKAGQIKTLWLNSKQEHFEEAASAIESCMNSEYEERVSSIATGIQQPN